MGNNILSLEDFVLNVKIGHTVIKSCGVKISIKARQRDQFLKRRLFAKNNGVVPSHSKTMIPLLLILSSNNRDHLFHSATKINLTLYTHIIDHKTLIVLVRNTFNQLLHILR